MDSFDQNFQRETKNFFANVLKNMVPDLNVLVRELKYLDRCTILCCIKNPVTHAHTHTLRVQTLFSHSDKSPKQTKTQTSQQGSHRQKSPWPEVIRFYSNEKTLHETVQSVLTFVNFKYMLACICIFKNSGLVFSSIYLIWTAWTKIFRRKPKFFANILKNMVPDLNVLVRELKYLDRCIYNTMLHQKSSDTHTHTHCECKHFSLTQISLQNRQKLKLLNKDLIVRSLPGQKQLGATANRRLSTKPFNQC